MLGDEEAERLRLEDEGKRVQAEEEKERVRLEEEAESLRAEEEERLRREEEDSRRPGPSPLAFLVPLHRVHSIQTFAPIVSKLPN